MTAGGGGVPRPIQLGGLRARELDLTALGFSQRGKEVRVWARKGAAAVRWPTEGNREEGTGSAG